MPTLSLATALLVPLLLHTPATAIPPDPTVTDGDKYKVILDNDQVRVIEYRDKPGDTTKQHHHKPFVIYILAPFKRQLTFPDGTVKTREFKAGEVFWMEEQTHIGKNVGTTESRALIVEPKSAGKTASKEALKEAAEAALAKPATGNAPAPAPKKPEH